MKKVLFISYFFPPIANSGTQRPLKFANYLPDFGWEPIILTVDHPPETTIDPALMRDVRPDTKVFRAMMLSDRIAGWIARPLPRNIGARVAEGANWRLRELWQSPDGWAAWRRPAGRRAWQILQTVGFDVVLATGGPYTSFLVGADVARRSKRPLVLDYRDPWAGGDDYSMAAGLTSSRQANHLRLERHVLEHAAAVITVSDHLTALVKSLAPQSTIPMVTITNGYDAREFSEEKRLGGRSGKFRIVFTGVWKSTYGPEPLYEALASLRDTHPDVMSRLEVVTAGYAPGPAVQRGLSTWITELGRLPRAEAITLIQSADALFVAVPRGANHLLVLTGKVFDYLASGRPILALAHPDGDLAALLRRVGGGVSIDPDDRNRLKEVLVDAVTRQRLDVPPQNPDVLKTYERRALTKDLADTLDRVTSQAPPTS